MNYLSYAKENIKKHLNHQRLVRLHSILYVIAEVLTALAIFTLMFLWFGLAV